MIKSYFYLYRFILENLEELTGATVTNIYTQEKDKLFLALPNSEKPFRHLIINANPNFTSLLLKEEHHKAKKNFKDFIPELLPNAITKIEICENDRIVKFTLQKFEIYFAVMGARSNVFFAHNGKFEAFRKNKIEGLNAFLSNKNFITPVAPFHFPENSPQNFDLLKKDFPFLNKFIRNEFYTRFNLPEGKVVLSGLEKICNEFLENKIAIGLNEKDYGVRMYPAGWKIFQDLTLLDQQEKINNAIISYFSFYYKFTKEKKLKREISSALTQQLEKLSNKLNELSNRVEEGSKENLYRKFADLLSVNRHKVFKGLENISVEDFESGKEISISLDQKLDAQGNIEKYYEKARNEKTAYEKSVELFNESKEKYNQLFELRQRLEDISDLKELEYLKKKLHPGKVNGKGKEKIKFRHFLIDGRYHLFVGRDSSDNDELTFRFAKQNDYWFHARGYAGSHVVLRNENPKEKMPKNILKTAASVAAFYSKGKTASLVPVSYTFRKYVRKKKGMPPGKVLLQKEDTLIVKPEIPTNCEQIFE